MHFSLRLSGGRGWDPLEAQLDGLSKVAPAQWWSPLLTDGQKVGRDSPWSTSTAPLVCLRLLSTVTESILRQTWRAWTPEGQVHEESPRRNRQKLPVLGASSDTTVSFSPYTVGQNSSKPGTFQGGRHRCYPSMEECQRI